MDFAFRFLVFRYSDVYRLATFGSRFRYNVVFHDEVSVFVQFLQARVRRPHARRTRFRRARVRAARVGRIRALQTVLLCNNNNGASLRYYQNVFPVRLNNNRRNGNASRPRPGALTSKYVSTHPAEMNATPAMPPPSNICFRGCANTLCLLKRG